MASLPARSAATVLISTSLKPDSLRDSSQRTTHLGDGQKAQESGTAVAAPALDHDRTDIGGWRRCATENNFGTRYVPPAAVFQGGVQVPTPSEVEVIPAASATSVEQHLPPRHGPGYLGWLDDTRPEASGHVDSRAVSQTGMVRSEKRRWGLGSRVGGLERWGWLSRGGTRERRMC